MNQTFADVGIEIPPDKTGQVRVDCPKCKGTSKVTLSVKTDSGLWQCWRCGFSGKLGTKEGAKRRVMQKEIDHALIVLAIAKHGRNVTPKDREVISRARSAIRETTASMRKLSVLPRRKDISIAVMMAEREQNR